MDFSRLTLEQLDAIKEVSNIGMGHAATALSQLTGLGIGMKVPEIRVMKLASVPEVLGGAEQMVVGVYLQMLGDARGNIMLVFPRASALSLLERLVPEHSQKGLMLTELQTSALKEVGNILASAYLNALGTFLKITVLPSTPVLSIDMAGAVVDYVLADLAELGDVSLMIETEFSCAQDMVKGHFFLLPDHDSIDLILRATCP
jgi:chemotaxis protein CheC